MFSLLLSAEDEFSIPMDTSEPDSDSAATSHHPPLMGMGTATTTVPQALQQFPQAPQHSPSPHPPPPFLPSNPPPTSASGHNGISAAVPSLPPQPAFTAARQPGSLKRCDDDVQFVSEKPVKRRKLDSPAPSNSVGIQQQQLRMRPPQTAPPHPPITKPEGEEEVGCVAPPISNHTHTSVAAPENGPRHGETDATERGTSLPSLENYVFPTSFPKDPAICRQSSPQLSPKQILDTIGPSLLQRTNSQSVISSPEKSLGSPRDAPGDGVDGVDGVNGGDVGGKAAENKSGAPPALLHHKVPPNGSMEPPTAGGNTHATQQVKPVDQEPKPQVPGFTPSREMSGLEVSSRCGPVTNSPRNPPVLLHDQPGSRERSRQQHHPGPTALSPTAPPSGQSNSWHPDSATALQHHNPVASLNLPPRAPSPRLQSPTTGEAWPHSDHTSPANTVHGTPRRGGQPDPPPPGANAAIAQPMGMRRHPRPQPRIQTQNQSQAHSQSHSQSHHPMGSHPSGSGPSKGPCAICTARRQQVAYQKAALVGMGGSMGAFHPTGLPPGPMQSHTAAAPNGAGYNVVFVPTPMQGQGFPVGSQFAGHPSPNANSSGAMGLSSHPCALNPQQGAMVAPAHQAQDTAHTGQPGMMSQSQQARPRPEPRVSPQQGQPPKRFPHQEHSPGKHIIVDIADTAMEVFPFAKVAKRHNVAADKVRNIFEAVVAVPFLRVATDKRRAGKVGQERVKKYLIAKKDLEKQAEERGEGGQVSAYEVARAMGPKAPGGRADGFPGPW